MQRGCVASRLFHFLRPRSFNHQPRKNQTMKHLLPFAFALFAFFARPTSAQEASAALKNFRAHEVQIDAYASSTRADILGAPTYGAGVGVNYFLTRGLGAGLRATTYNTQDAAVDDGELRLIFRAPLWDRIAPYAFVTGFHNFDENSWGAGAGGGLEVRLWRAFGVFGEAGLRTTIPGGNNKTAAGAALIQAGGRLTF